MQLVIFITGGSKGLGKSLVNYLCGKGHLIITTFNKTEIEMKSETNIEYYKLNVSNYNECQQVIPKIIEKYKKIDVLINNVGIIRNCKFEKMSFNDWNDVINTNLNSIFNVSQLIVNNMITNGGGKIINISSISGLKGNIGQTNYCSSKFGMIGFTKALALELANKNITVNAICPGLINTDLIKNINAAVLEKIVNQIPNKHVLEMDEINSIIEMILNTPSMTGSIISLDGGMTC